MSDNTEREVIWTGDEDLDPDDVITVEADDDTDPDPECKHDD